MKNLRPLLSFNSVPPISEPVSKVPYDIIKVAKSKILPGRSRTGFGLVPGILEWGFRYQLQCVRSDKAAVFGPPRQDQSTAPRRAAHLEHTNTPRAPFFSVRAAVLNFFA